MRESEYQAKLIKRIKRMFPGCYVEKGDSSKQQGMLDLTIFWKDCWAKLEVKADERSPHRPNQDYFVKTFNDMSFAAFIYPENEEEVLRALQGTFAADRSSCVS